MQKALQALGYVFYKTLKLLATWIRTLRDVWTQTNLHLVIFLFYLEKQYHVRVKKKFVIITSTMEVEFMACF